MKNKMKDSGSGKKTNLFLILFSLILATSTITACVDYEVILELRNDGSFKQFSSLEEINSFLSRTGTSGIYSDGIATRTMSAESAPAFDSIDSSFGTVAGNEQASEFSETNIQVKGVDEADIVKNDGKYIYYLTNNKIYILDAYPAENMNVISEIEIEDSYLRELYIYEDKLVVLGNAYKSREDVKTDSSSPVSSASASDGPVADIAMIAPDLPRIMPPYLPSRNYGFIAIYNIEDRSRPIQEEEIITDGYYFNSRLIDNNLYVIINNYVGNNFFPPVIYYREGQREILPSDVYYFDIYDYSYELSTIFAIDVEDNSFAEKSMLKGSSQNIFVSHENIYLTGRKNIPYYTEQRMIIDEVYKELLPSRIVNKINRIDSYDIREISKISEIEHIVYTYFSELEPRELESLMDRMERAIETIRQIVREERDKTLINRISIDSKNVEMKAAGEVPGYVLNQFSMDENNGYFRIATTRGSMWDERNPSSNNIYVLDMELNIVGSKEKIAPTERIYSVRFMGDKAYMVTFRDIDPLFVIDLSNPTSPEILGELKIPGYSDYLHPYDENHIIGIGKEVVENADRAIPEGVKLALFDVSDVNSPREIAKTEIGYRGSESESLYDHKAFLFDKSRDLLVIPVLERGRPEDSSRPWFYGDIVFQGAYVFNITPEFGFVEKGRITHVTSEEISRNQMFLWSDNSIRRTLYMDDVLYTLSGRTVKANSLNTLREVNSLVLYVLERQDETYGYGVAGSARDEIPIN